MNTVETNGKIVSVKKQKKNQTEILKVKNIVTEILKTHWMGSISHIARIHKGFSKLQRLNTNLI